ncbi:MAG: hypothetical protein N3B01_07445 [Verrucomicrobiae bacterium]|nr:hypothetical protein [Verrucomicrobiae bacterium]
MNRRFKSESGQHLVEYAVALALIAAIVVVVVKGIGLQSAKQLAAVNQALDEQRVAASTAPGGVVGASPAQGQKGKGTGSRRGESKQSLGKGAHPDLQPPGLSRAGKTQGR